MAMATFPSTDLGAYPHLVDLCDIHGWETHLGQASGRLELAIYDGKKILAQAKTGHAMPQGLRFISAECARQLEQKQLIG